jgi:hypothetical protein
MTQTVFKNLVNKFNVPDSWYSVNGELKSDACILYKNYSMWEYFYFSEKGDRYDCKVFENEDSAFDFLWNKMKYLLRFYNKI